MGRMCNVMGNMTGLCHSRFGVMSFGIMSHSGLCRIPDYVVRIMSFRIMDYVVRYTVGVSMDPSFYSICKLLITNSREI